MAMPTKGRPGESLDSAALLRLLQLTSPALPVGAYSYSQGLEWAVEAGWVREEKGAAAWIGGLLAHQLARLDVPMLARLYRAWQGGDGQALEYWSYFLRACRESAELAAEDQNMGQALARLLAELEITEAEPWRTHRRASLACLFALAAVRWEIPLPSAAAGYLWCWCEQLTAAALKLIPLGQSAGQRILGAVAARIPEAVARGLALEDDEIGSLAPGAALASARHEGQYTRLFRS